jgi:PKD repeat protein
VLRRFVPVLGIVIIMLSFTFTQATNVRARPKTMMKQHALADFPTVDPNYIYDQLYYMVTHYQHREAGYDTSTTPVSVNGHNAFATYWANEAVKDLQGFGPQVLIDQFPIQGWEGRPAVVPAYNVEVTVPGVLHPEQVVVIGCHYDGEAISTQSANDDGSGCAIELGVAQAMGNYWRSHHVYPARTLRFVIFDAEEQGLWGSFHYLNSTINGDTHNIVAMFNEEQNGIAYPLRYLGNLSNPLMPFFVDMSPLTNNSLYPHQDRLSAQQKSAIMHFRSLMTQAVPAVFAQFQALGFQTLLYHGDNKLNVSQPIFTSSQTKNIHLEDDTLGGSDEIPFTLAGIPSATFIGNFTYYDKNPPPGSYPYDQKQDTIQLMNTFANGSAQKAPALTLSLALPGMFTTWMLHQPSVLGESPSTGNPIAAISDIGQTVVSQPLALNANASYTPANPNAPLAYSWNFGDGTTASGISVSHTYTKTGNYILTLTVSSSIGSARISKVIDVGSKPTQYSNPYALYQSNGMPPPNPQVVLPIPAANQRTNQIGKKTAPHTNTNVGGSGLAPGIFILISIVILIVIIAVIGAAIMINRRKKREA